MLLLDLNNEPTNTVYYLAAITHGFLLVNDGLDYSELYKKMSEDIFDHDVNFEHFSLGLNFLFLLDKINVDKKGGLHVYS
ncbi:MAG: hypothetical protein LBV67_06175 [Streptococcaceae bacterium]|jgi:hypothetical protein|nr:hypothetical protein [Streptococcaceae bacterium]